MLAKLAAPKVVSMASISTAHTRNSPRQNSGPGCAWVNCAFCRASKGFFRALTAAEEGSVNEAAVADGGGYADRSHLCRKSRRVTGFSPQRLRPRMETDERFWACRAWE